jgi:membrane protein implicated in regulation of membrane protease activity
MNTDPSRPKLGQDAGRGGGRARHIFARVLTVAAGAAVLIGAIAVSIVVFAFVFAGLLVFGIYFWWRMRGLRKQMQATHAASANDDVIEGEVIRRSGKDGRPDA